MNQLQPYRKRELYNNGTRGHYGFHEPRSGKEQLEQVIDLLYKGKWIILLTFLVVFGAVALYTSTLEPEYETGSLVMVSGREGSSNSGRSANPYSFMGGPPMQWGRSIENEITLLRTSQALPEAVAKRLLQRAEDAGDSLSVAKAQKGNMLSRGLPIVTALQGDTLSKKQIAARVRGRVRFASGEGNMIQIRAADSSPVQAAVIANLFAQEYVKMTREVNRASLVASREYLQEELEKQEQEIRSIEGQIENYLRQKGTVSIEGEGSRLASQLSQMRGRRDQIEVEMNRRKTALRALEDQLETVRPDLAKQVASTIQQDIQLVQQKIGELKAEKQTYLINNPGWEEDGPQLQKINRQIQQLNQKVNELSQKYVDEVLAAGATPSDSSQVGNAVSGAAGLKQQITSHRIAIMGLEAELAALDQHIEKYRSEIKSVPGETIQIERLRRERQRAESMYNFILQKLQETRVQEQRELGYASIIADASVPAQPVRPQTYRNLILGAFFGLIFGVGLALIRYKFDNRLYRPDDLEDEGYNTTVIPDMKDLIASRYSGKSLVKKGDRDLATTLMTLHQPTSSIAESYHQLRTNIQLGLPNLATRTVVVTSAGVGEGKSTTAANLAIAFARGGARTLLLDTDMRRPQAHRLLGLELEPGLHQLLRGQFDYDPKQMETGIENLFAITAGKAASETASELLGGTRMEELFGVLKEQFDIIIVDTPPTLAVTDPKLLASRSDAVLMVVRAGETKEKEFEHAVRELQRAGAYLLGVAVNGFDLSMAYDYKYRYRGYSDYGHYAGYAHS